MDRYIGKKLEGRYEILELLGFGGMAIVFKAYDLLENKYVAVKILKDEFLQNDDFKRRFRNESKAIALLSHPGIVKVSDVNFSDNIQYIVMEYIDGITLKEYIEQQGSVKWKEAVHFTVQILRALQHAHDNGIVHRDVKPQNVMLLEDGTIKVMDFGIARFARENGKTMSDKAIGSVHYISPEQAQGDNTDERTDIYAVGVIMYEMLTGKVPFDGDTPVSIAIKQMQMEPQNPTLINPEIPIGLEEIILRAMQKDPQLRYQTAAEMLRDIDEFKRNPSVIFEYKYFNKDGTTKYFNKIDSHKLPASASAVAAATYEPKKRSYTMNILAGVTAACVLLAAVALYFFFKALNSSPPDVAVPQVVGMTVAQAESEFVDLSFKITDEKPSPEYEKGIIIDQTEKAGSKVKIKSSVGVVVSSGIEALVMPNLVNETSSAAKSKLIALGIKNIETVKKIDPTIQFGRIVSTTPAADEEVLVSDNVILYVSTGAPDLPVRVPTLIGKTEIEARSELIREGLILGAVTREDSIEQKGTVISQSVEPEERVEKGTRIDVVLSTGATPVESEPEIDDGIPRKSITINFPTGADNKDFTFEVFANKNVSVETITVNPATQSSLIITLTLEDGMINGMSTALEDNEIMLLLPSGIFATYNVNFTTGTVEVLQKPNYNLIFEKGYAEPV